MKRGKYGNDRHGLLRLPEPRNDAEFAILTEWHFGMPLSLRGLSARCGGCYYEIEQSYGSYHGDGFTHTRYASDSYDHSREFLGKVFGRLQTGGTGARSYGSTSANSWRQIKRLLAWEAERRSIRRGAKGSPPSKPFERLAERTRARREQTEAGLCLS